MDAIRVRRLIAFAALTFIVAALALPRSAFADDWTLHGQVVDAETGEPLPGAIILVIWRNKLWLAMDGNESLHKTTEFLADAEGRFSIDASPGINCKPWRYLLERPSVVIFHTGYGPFPNAMPKSIPDRLEGKRFMTWTEEIDALRAGMVVKLPKLKNREDFARYSGFVGLGISGDVPIERIPNTWRIMRQHRINAGLTPYREDND